MKRGFRVLISKGVPTHLGKEAMDRCVKFIQMAQTEQSYRTGGQSSRSFYKRGILGYRIDKTNLVFKRLSRNRRIFGVIPIEDLVYRDGEPAKFKDCVCTYHSGGQRVNLRPGLDVDSDFNLVHEEGDIKG